MAAPKFSQKNELYPRIYCLLLVIVWMMLASCATTSNTSEPPAVNEDRSSPTLSLTTTPTSMVKPSQPAQLTPTFRPSETPPKVEPEAGQIRVWESDGAEMVYIPAGPFYMGSNEDNPNADNDEYPQHEVFLNGFWIDRFEVTNELYALCVWAEVCAPPYETGSFSRDTYYSDPAYADYPVVWVTWSDAVRYCEWSGKELPTEAQWEKAARGTDKREYPWGNTNPDETIANYGGNVGDTTAVGFYSPVGDSPYGCADMAGNVLEWVKDWYGGAYYPILNQVNNPTGASKSFILSKVARGGSWLYPARRARSPLRVDRLPELREGNIGFRCVFSY